ncbi:MAG: Gfo/Idh/MocA family oxidoreductase [Planctomycetes bacterium]|nr:Gfo/Idh/MocA family oxidoreductase [Planctomycetota bacterium]
MGSQTRRSFLKSAAASTVFSTFTIAGTKSSGNVLGANDVIRIGVAGLNGRGSAHISAFAGRKDAQVTYIADPDSRLFDGRIKQVESRGGNTPKAVNDIRTALDDKQVDAVSIATPNHWHSLIAIWACQAGKDAYVEKPCSHNIHESRILVETARKHKRIVQHGTQRRTGATGVKAKQIAAGELGKLTTVRVKFHGRRNSIGLRKPQPPPKELDYNLWLGPAPLQPFHSNLVHYNWHWFWDFGGGEMANNGVHFLDLARWMIPNATLPRRVFSIGGRFGYKDQAQTPNTQIVVYDYGETILTCEIRNLIQKAEYGVTTHFDENAAAQPVKVTGSNDVKNPLAARGPGGDIFGNFLHAMRTRQSQDLDAHILEGHYSAALCHLANISYRLGKEAPFSKKAKSLGDDKELPEMFEQMRDHLKDNGVKLEESTYRVGRTLRIDAASESFIDDDEANLLLTRKYRHPFTVPDKVV